MSGLQRNQRIGLLIAVAWIVIVVAVAVTLRSLPVLALLGLLAVLLIPFRKKS